MRELEAQHRVRGGGLPQYRRVLEAAARHHDDPGRASAPAPAPSATSRPASPTRSTRTSPRASPRRWRSSASAHVVVTSVDRDDLDDGGAGAFRRAPSRRSARAAPGTTIEVLTPDFLRKDGALEAVVAARPDVYNHNLETVPRLYAEVRPGARYFPSLRLLDRVKELDPAMFTKSGLMVGLGEEQGGGAAGDGRSARGRGRFPHHRPVSPADAQAPRASTASSRPRSSTTIARWPAARASCMVSASPLTRSSYLAGDDFAQLRAARARKLAARA